MIEIILAVVLAVWIAFSILIIMIGIRKISDLETVIVKKDNNLKELNEKIDFVKSESLSQSKEVSNLLKQNEIFRMRHAEYRQFFDISLSVLSEDTSFLRMSMFKAFASVPEFQDANKLMVSFENKIEAIKSAMREYKMIDMDDQ